MPSFHDCAPTGYQVDCDVRRIQRCIRCHGLSRVVFSGVQGYRFAHDAFTNILFGWERIPIDEFLALHGAEMAAPMGRGLPILRRLRVSSQGWEFSLLSNSSLELARALQTAGAW
jgi:hypothetical protein